MYDPDLIVKLNAALRHREYRAELFEKATGKNLDRLWTEFLDKQARPRRSEPPKTSARAEKSNKADAEGREDQRGGGLGNRAGRSQ